MRNDTSHTALCVMQHNTLMQESTEPLRPCHGLLVSLIHRYLSCTPRPRRSPAQEKPQEAQEELSEARRDPGRVLAEAKRDPR